MTLNQQAASGQVADDVEIAAMVAGSDGLRVLLQPQVDLLTGRIVSAEALARWQHPAWARSCPLISFPRSTGRDWTGNCSSASACA